MRLSEIQTIAPAIEVTPAAAVEPNVCMSSSGWGVGGGRACLSARSGPRKSKTWSRGVPHDHSLRAAFCKHGRRSSERTPFSRWWCARPGATTSAAPGLPRSVCSRSGAAFGLDEASFPSFPASTAPRRPSRPLAREAIELWQRLCEKGHVELSFGGNIYPCGPDGLPLLDSRWFQTDHDFGRWWSTGSTRCLMTNSDDQSL